MNSERRMDREEGEWVEEGGGWERVNARRWRGWGRVNGERAKEG